MKTVPIPDWNQSGVLPYAVDNEHQVSKNRSPYPVTIVDMVNRFATSKKRIDILQGLLKYRAAMHAFGLTSGFQWLSGSFVIDVKTLENRSPNDIDVVNFIDPPQPTSQTGDWNNEQEIFSNRHLAKRVFLVDGYFVQMSLCTPRELIKKSAYWCNIMTYPVKGLSRGFLQLDLNPELDKYAVILLDQKSSLIGVNNEHES